MKLKHLIGHQSHVTWFSQSKCSNFNDAQINTYDIRS